MNYALGLTVFTSDIPPQKVGFTKNREWSTENNNKPPVWVGIGEERVSLAITIIDGCGSNRKQILADLDTQSRQGTPLTLQVLTATTATSLGEWCITSINEDYEYFQEGAPLKVDCQIELLRYQPIANNSNNNYNDSQPSNTATQSNQVIQDNVNDWLYGNSGRSSNVDEQTALLALRS